MMLSREWQRNQRSADDPSGTLVPFTAPLLCGVCVRRAGSKTDFLLPNPSGGRGIYVVSWASIAEYASPTLHDVVLAGRLAELPVIDPPSVRSLAQAVGSEGYAGRAVAEAAERAAAREQGERLRLWSRLLMALIDAAGLLPEERIGHLQKLGQAGPCLMTPGLEALSIRLGWTPAGLFDALARLSAAYTPVLPNGRFAVLLTRFDRMRGEIAHEISLLRADRGSDHDLPAPLRRLLPDLERCRHHGQSVFDAAASLLERPLDLLILWQAGPIAPLRLIADVETGLDGWDRIAALWMSATSATARIAVLPELALLARLAAERSQTDPDTVPDPVHKPVVPEPAAEDDERPAAPRFAGSASELVARNERARVLELDLGGAHG